MGLRNMVTDEEKGKYFGGDEESDGVSLDALSVFSWPD